jgi:hypothetical protein
MDVPIEVACPFCGASLTIEASRDDRDDSSEDTFLKEMFGVQLQKYHYCGVSICANCMKEVYLTLTVSGGANVV